MKSIRINIYGRVQGVGFRYFVKEKAKMLDIKGFVKNLSDRSVYVEAEGNNTDIETFVSYCNQGPSYASVKNIKINENDCMNFTKFEIRY